MKLIWTFFFIALFFSPPVYSGGRTQGNTISDALSMGLNNFELGRKQNSILDNEQTMAPPRCQESIFDSFKAALVYNDATLLASSNAFRFRNTLNKIIATSPSRDTNSVELVQSMLKSYRQASMPKPDSGIAFDVDIRNGGANLDAAGLIDHMEPVALFNRFDLALSDGTQCGEFRIVYAKKNFASGGFFTIFEARYPNPRPAEGIVGCAPIVDFWLGLRQMSASQALAQLERFFLHSVNHDGTFLPAVVGFDHYAFSKGQVRTNNFVQGIWQLRECRTALNSSKVVFQADTVKSDSLVLAG